MRNTREKSRGYTGSREHRQNRGRNQQYDEYDQRGTGYPDRNEDYYIERETDRRGFRNRDYSGDNFWPDNDRVREERRDDHTDYVPSSDYGRSHGYNDFDGPASYGNERSQSMRDYNNWQNRNYQRTGGYRGRDARDYENDYANDEYHYDPADYDRESRRRNPDAEYRNQYADRGYDRDLGPHYQRPSYGEYESYPSYRSPGDPHNYGNWPRESRRHRNKPETDDREYGNRRRPYIRDSRY